MPFCSSAAFRKYCSPLRHVRQRFTPPYNIVFLTAINETPHNTAPYCHNTIMPNRSIPMAVSYNGNVRTLPLSTSYRAYCLMSSMQTLFIQARIQRKYATKTSIRLLRFTCSIPKANGTHRIKIPAASGFPLLCLSSCRIHSVIILCGNGSRHITTSYFSLP